MSMPSPQEKMVRTGYYIPERLKLAIEDEAFQQTAGNPMVRCSASAVLAAILQRWLDHKDSSGLCSSK